MGKLVVLEFGEGDFDQGFPVTLQIAEEGKSVSTKITGRLPAAPQVERSYENWQSRYFDYRRFKSSMRLGHVDTEIQNIGEFLGDPVDECIEAGSELSYTLNEWLKSNSFAPIREGFFRKIKYEEKIRIILQTDDRLLWKLPWNLWELLTEYQYAEIALSPIKYEFVSRGKSQRKLKILAILGNNINRFKKNINEIDIQKDFNILKQQLPGANLEFVIEPNRKQLNDKLWEQGWDILFFAGHSESEGDLKKGWIKINQTERLSIEDLKFALKKAIKKGLSLAIFNSCDGLGLASELSAMQIPQMIVMRESIPDIAAQEFLKHFLKAFAGGKSLYLAVREARERLQGLENQFPCASWLPVIFQNPACTPLTWIPRSYAPKLQTVMAASFAVAVLVSGVRYLGWLQPLELKAYDQMMQQRPEEELDSRIVVVEVNHQNFLDEKPKPKKTASSSLADSTFVQLLKEVSKHQPRVIGLDIYQDLPAGVQPNPELEKLFQETENLFGICQVNELNGKRDGVPPATFIPKENLGFSDVLLDNSDDVLRRHILSIKADSTSPCTADSALSWQLAVQYLQKEGIKPEITREGDMLGKARLEPLLARSGGYQTFTNNGSDNKGLDYPQYRILLNYRRTSGTVFLVVNVNSVLNRESYIPELLKDRIVIIGVTAPDVKRPDGNLDEFQTPLGVKMRGVYIHAQMVSQLVSAALGERRLLGVWAWWLDGLWICGWSFVGGLIVWRVWRVVPLVLITVGGIFILYGSCFLLFVLGTWVPFVPPLLTLVSSGGVLICYGVYRRLGVGD
jgi:CHASE2 domain-containing sensor protein